MIPRRHFRDFFCGRAGREIVIATLPAAIGFRMSALTLDVRLRLDYAQKILTRHRLTYEDLHVVQIAIDQGYCFQSRKERHLEFLYFDKPGDRTGYAVVVKTARWGQEVWLATFHRTDQTSLRSKRRKLQTVRQHL